MELQGIVQRFPESTLNDIKTGNCDTLKRYESTNVGHTAWLIAHSGTNGPSAVTLANELQYKQETSSNTSN